MMGEAIKVSPHRRAWERVHHKVESDCNLNARRAHLGIRSIVSSGSRHGLSCVDFITGGEVQDMNLNFDTDTIGRPRTNLLSRQTVEAAARRYYSTGQASQALGVTQWGFLRACDRYQVEPPGVKRRKSRLTASVCEAAVLTYQTVVDAASALNVNRISFRRACRRHGIQMPKGWS